MYFRYWGNCYLDDLMTIRKGFNIPLLRSSDLFDLGITINMSSLPGFWQRITCSVNIYKKWLGKE